MYIVDKDNNRIQKVSQHTFQSLGIHEREHLQEWIANEPQCLGEELLIIQKEFSGFDDTKERLDLLALDKSGNLVIIENKLDDSGKDVTWQAIKYASYCSTLSKQDIINIYQSYLGNNKSAEDSLSDFYDGKDLTEIQINGSNNNQRIILVAANFRKEVTSSVLWLLNNGINIKCFNVSPFILANQIFLDFQQIIPIKDTEDYMIKIATKNKEESQNNEATRIRHKNRKEFWNLFIDYNKNYGGLYKSSTGTEEPVLVKSLKGFSGVNVQIHIVKDKSRCEIFINSQTKDKCKQIFDYFYSKREDIKKYFEDNIIWLRQDDCKTCSIRIERDLSYLNSEEHNSIFKFFTECANQMIKVFGKYASEYNTNNIN